MIKKFTLVAALLASFSAHAGLTREENDSIVNLIKNRYVPMGLTAPEIIVLIRELGNRSMQYDVNKDGTVTFVYEKRNDAGLVVELGPVYTIRLRPESAPDTSTLQASRASQ